MNVLFEDWADPASETVLPYSPLNEEFVFPEGTVLPQTAEALDIDSFFNMAIAQRVSDIHLRWGYPPFFRKDGRVLHTQLPPMTEKAMQRFATRLVPQAVHARFVAKHNLDFSVDFHKARFRVNVLYEMGRLGFSIRIVPVGIPTLSELGLPESVLSLTRFENGLVLVTGAAGCGKSTTLAAMLNTINHTQAKHLVTLEDPVEFVYTSRRAVVTQRELGSDFATFPEGIRDALRQDCNILLIGEIRDRETAFHALKAAETGILVFSTLHTTDAVQTLRRLIHFFEPGEREAIRLQLADSLRGVISQQLAVLADGSDRTAVAEILLMTPTIRDYLLQNHWEEMVSLMESGRTDGMQTMNNALFRAVQKQHITPEEAIRISNHPVDLQQRLKGAFHGTTLIG